MENNFSIRISKDKYNIFNEIAEISKSRMAGNCSGLPIPYYHKPSLIKRIINRIKKIK